LQIGASGGTDCKSAEAGVGATLVVAQKNRIPKTTLISEYCIIDENIFGHCTDFFRKIFFFAKKSFYIFAL